MLANVQLSTLQNHYGQILDTVEGDDFLKSDDLRLIVLLQKDWLTLYFTNTFANLAKILWLIACNDTGSVPII